MFARPEGRHSLAVNDYCRGTSSTCLYPANDRNCKYEDMLGAYRTRGSRTSERGRPHFAEILNDLLRRFPTKFQHFPIKCSLSPKISDDIFFSHRPFSCFNVLFFRRGGQIRNRHRYRANSIANFDGGHGRICPPWIRHWPIASLVASHV